MRTVAVSTMRVQLSASVALGNIELGQVADTSDLNVIRGLYEVRALDGSIRNEAGAVTALETPRDFDALGLTNRGLRTGLGRSEQTKVIDRVDCMCI